MNFNYVIVSLDTKAVIGLTNQNNYETEGYSVIKLEQPLDPEVVELSEYIYNGSDLEYNPEEAKKLYDELAKVAPPKEVIE